MFRPSFFLKTKMRIKKSEFCQMLTPKPLITLSTYTSVVSGNPLRSLIRNLFWLPSAYVDFRCKLIFF